jgi:hypothetical protein
MTVKHDGYRFSRRAFLVGAGASGVAAATPLAGLSARAFADPTSLGGTPEQVHLTWGADPTRSVVVSWASPGQSTNARVRVWDQNGGAARTLPAVQRIYTDGLNGETVWTYHAALDRLRPGAQYRYAVTADNDSNGADPFSATFRTAPEGQAPFRFTSFGDLATPNTAWVLSYGQSTYAVDQVNAQQPLFHLLNGDLCYANLNPASQPEVWRDFGNNNERSAAFRPWMPCPGNHELEFDNGHQGLDSYLTRYTLPDNGVPGFEGRWYTFRVGSVQFISLAADDVIYQDAAAFVGGPASLMPSASTGNPPIPPGTSLYVNGYSKGQQTAWLRRTLAAARADDAVDWIVVQMHECALSSSMTGNGSDLGIRQAWLHLFDRYQVDLVLCGHDHDYERSFPVRGVEHDVGLDNASGAPVDTLRPIPVTTNDRGEFDTSRGTVHLILGGGGTSAPLEDYGVDTSNGLPEAKIFTRRNTPMPTATPGVFGRAGADAHEDAVWSAKRDPSTGYGIAVFDVDPDHVDDRRTEIRVTYLHAPGADAANPNTGAAGGPNPNYTVFDTFRLTRPRRDRHGRQDGGNRQSIFADLVG